MEINQDSPDFQAAIRDFRRAHQRAVLEQIFGHLTGKSAGLLSYDDISQILRNEEPVDRGRQEIPLNAIVGSVGRYTDFTRSFLPRRESDKHHWAEVKAAVSNRDQMPPIEVYQIDQVYLVVDGNHRVSIARQLGHTHILANVTEIKTDVPLSPDIEANDLICKIRYAEFLENTGLKSLRPKADLSLTAPGNYQLLAEQIQIHQHWLSQQQGAPVSYPEAVADWYDEIYWPIVKIIRQRGILRRFPERTETDLYVWIFKHRAELKEMVGWEVAPEDVAGDLVERYVDTSQQLMGRVKRRLQEAISGPAPGTWRRAHVSGAKPDCLFTDILAPVSERDTGWAALKQAAVVAWREKSRLHGLHIVDTADQAEGAVARRLQAEFQQRCENSGVSGELTIETGRPVRNICRRARFVDLIVIYLSHMHRPQPGERLRSGFSSLLRTCSRPVLAVPNQHAPLNRALLAYDGSPKANEALFVAAYLAGKWQISLAVVTVLEKKHITSETLARARQYLTQRGVEADYIQEEGVIAEAIVRAARRHHSDFMIMGGYGFNPVMEVMLGSEVDQILRAREWPVLICQ